MKQAESERGLLPRVRKIKVVSVNCADLEEKLWQTVQQLRDPRHCTSRTADRKANQALLVEAALALALLIAAQHPEAS